MVANNAEQKRKRETIEFEDMNAKCGLNSSKSIQIVLRHTSTVFKFFIELFTILANTQREREIERGRCQRRARKNVYFIVCYCTKLTTMCNVRHQKWWKQNCSGKNIITKIWILRRITMKKNCKRALTRYVCVCPRISRETKLSNINQQAFSVQKIHICCSFLFYFSFFFRSSQNKSLYS